MEEIDSGLVALAEDVIRLKIRSIAIPPLGSGLGGLDWPEVHKLMYFMQEAGAPLRLQYVKAPIWALRQESGACAEADRS